MKHYWTAFFHVSKNHVVKNGKIKLRKSFKIVGSDMCLNKNDKNNQKRANNVY